MSHVTYALGRDFVVKWVLSLSYCKGSSGGQDSRLLHKPHIENVVKPKDNHFPGVIQGPAARRSIFLVFAWSGDWQRLKTSLKPLENKQFNDGWKLQHLICGCIIDYWNIKVQNGSIGHCYYGNFGAKPIKSIPILFPASILSHKSNLSNKEKHKLDFWKANLPFKNELEEELKNQV